MDIISLGKANKTLREIKDLDEGVVGKGAESHFVTVDARLDWIESQADKIKIEKSLQVDLAQGVFENTEFVNGKIQLKRIGEYYVAQGTYESPIIDLGEGWKETKLVDVVSQVNGGGYTKSIVPAMTGNTSPSPYVAFGDYNTQNNPYIAFDQKDNAFVLKDTRNVQIGIDLGFPRKIDAYSITFPKYIYIGSSGVDFAPKHFKLEGSQNKTSWTVLDERIEETAWTFGEKRMYNIISSITANYRYYRIWVVSNNDGIRYTQIDEIGLHQEQLGTECKLELSTSKDGISFREYTLFDPANLPQARYVKIRATLSSASLLENDGTVGNIIQESMAVETPSLDSISIIYDTLTIEGRLKSLEKSNMINLAKLQFKTNVLMKSEKYQMHDLIIDTFQSSTLQTSVFYDEVYCLYKGEGEASTQVESLPEYRKQLMIYADFNECVFEYSLDGGETWNNAILEESIDISSQSGNELAIKITFLSEESELRSLAYGWA